MSVVSAIFGSDPKPGEIWDFNRQPEQDPWGGKKEKYQAVIIDVKDGWVRYGFVGSEFYNDERMKLSIFKFCYRRTT